MPELVESFNPEYAEILTEGSYIKRWQRILELFTVDYPSHRVLFELETLGLIEHWQEPKPERLMEMLSFRIQGGRFGVHIGNITKLLEPVWPLEMAKAEVQLYDSFAARYSLREYVLIHTKLWSTALLQAWWAFETLMNDLAFIILEQRKSGMTQVDQDLVQELFPSLDEKGRVVKKSSFQQLEARLLFIYRTLTGQEIDRGSSTWQSIMKMKTSRDSYTHRIGKDEAERTRILERSIVVDGLGAVRAVLGQALTLTPELAERFVYKYLAFWSCGQEKPFLWDGNQGSNFYLGLLDFDPETIKNLLAPKNASFSGLAGET